MKRRLSRVVVLFLLTGIAFSQSLSFDTPYTSDEGRYRAYFPGTPKEETQAGKDPDGNPITAHRASYGGDEYFLISSYVDYSYTVKSDHDGLDSIINGGFGNLPGSTVDERRYLTVQGFPAAYASGHTDDLVAATQVVIVEHRMYMMTVVIQKQYADKVTLKDAQRFFDSFVLLR